MNPNKFELKVLSEFISLYSDPGGTKKKYQRMSFGFKAVGVLVVLGSVGSVHLWDFGGNFGTFVGFVGGMLVGYGIFYDMTARQIPFTVDYTSIDIDKAKARVTDIET